MFECTECHGVNINVQDLLVVLASTALQTLKITTARFRQTLVTSFPTFFTSVSVKKVPSSSSKFDLAQPSPHFSVSKSLLHSLSFLLRITFLCHNASWNWWNNIMPKSEALTPISCPSGQITFFSYLWHHFITRVLRQSDHFEDPSYH